jgi:hypothetical protein
MRRVTEMDSAPALEEERSNCAVISQAQRVHSPRSTANMLRVVTI